MNLNRTGIVFQSVNREKIDTRLSSSCRCFSDGATVEDIGDVLAETIVAEEEVLEVGAHVVHLAVAVLAR